jgi:hypothetical protein
MGAFAEVTLTILQDVEEGLANLFHREPSGRDLNKTPSEVFIHFV